MSLWQRFKNCMQSKMSVALKKFEDPIEKTEHAIFVLKDLRVKSYKDLARVKALVLTTQDSISAKNDYAKTCELKALDLMHKAKDGALTQEQADELASQLLSNKFKTEKSVETLNTSLVKYKDLESKLEVKYAKVKQQISDCEFELSSLKARKSVAETLTALGQSSSAEDSDSVTSLMQEVESSVKNQEALALAYDSINTKTVEEQIDDVVGSPESNAVKEALAKLKEQVNEQ